MKIDFEQERGRSMPAKWLDKYGDKKNSKKSVLRQRFKTELGPESQAAFFLGWYHASAGAGAAGLALGLAASFFADSFFLPGGRPLGLGAAFGFAAAFAFPGISLETSKNFFLKQHRENTFGCLT